MRAAISRLLQAYVQKEKDISSNYIMSSQRISMLTSASEECQAEVKSILTLFPYFESWDEDVINECSRLGKITEALPDTIILGCEEGNLHMVHFILEGSCRLIQHLQVHVKSSKCGKKVYRMYEPKELLSPVSDAAEASYASFLFNRKLTLSREPSTQELVDEKKEAIEVPGEAVTEEELVSKEKEPPEITVTAEEAAEMQDAIPVIEVTISEEPEPEVEVEVEEAVAVQEEEPAPEEEPAVQEEEEEEVEEEEEEEEEDLEFNGLEEEPQVIGPPVSAEEADEEEEEEPVVETDSLQVPAKPTIIYDDDHHEKVLEECRRGSVLRKESLEKKCKPPKPSDVESHFMQIGLLYKGECFGLGESLKDRFIISVTKVKYLMIPRHFLLQHNPCNIWNRIKQFLTLYLPSNEKIFRSFDTNREWAENIRRESLRVVSMKEIPNFTLENDVPLSIRITERIVEEDSFYRDDIWKERALKRKTLMRYLRRRYALYSEMSSPQTGEGEQYEEEVETYIQ